MEYTKPWLSLEQQVELLENRGVEVGDGDDAAALLKAIGYYRLTGYLYPFKESEQYVGEDGRERTRVLSPYRPGTTLQQVAAVIDFDRRLRRLVMDGVERIEVAVRMRVGYVLGRASAFAHEDPTTFTEAFTTTDSDPVTGQQVPSSHARWLQRIGERRANSDEQFVAHFRQKYDGRMPIWALTEILELGQVSVLYRGLNQQDAEEIAQAFGVPTKKVMVSWLASLNYVRNVAAHHARLFNRKLQHAPARPKVGQIPLLDHLREARTAKGVFGAYNALSVIAYLPALDRPRNRVERPSPRALAHVPDVAGADDRIARSSARLGHARPLDCLTGQARHTRPTPRARPRSPEGPARGRRSNNTPRRPCSSSIS